MRELPEGVLGRLGTSPGSGAGETPYIRQARVNQLLARKIPGSRWGVDLTGDRVMRLYGNWKRCLGGHMEEHSYSRLLNMLEYKGVQTGETEGTSGFADGKAFWQV